MDGNEIVTSHAEEFAEGIMKYGSDMYTTASIFKAWLCYGVVSHPQYKRYGRNLDILIAELWEQENVRQAFDTLKLRPKAKTVQNWLPHYQKNVAPLVKKYEFEDGVSRAFTEHGKLMLRGESSPVRGELERPPCVHSCPRCCKH